MSDTASYTPHELASWSGGCWSRIPSTALAGVSTDSKTVARGSLFVALKGRNHDAHAFVPQAVRAGAAAVVVRSDYVWPESEGNEPCLLRVSDPNQALAELAAGYRLAVGARIVGVTGSAGKTTVKEMTAQLLSALGPTARTPGNKNNEVGLPLSLLAMPRTTRYGVFEAGMSHPGELAPLCATMRPEYGIVTNVGPVHLEAFGTVEGIANEKADLLRCLPKDGLAFLDRDGAQYDYLAAQASCDVVDVALHRDAAFRAEDIDLTGGTFAIRERGAVRSEIVVTGLPGTHNVSNALLAAAVARRLGASWDAVREAFLRVPRPPMRWEVSELRGVQVVNDAYNANPMSMKRALETFAKWPCKGRRVAVLGDMLELGAADEESLHFDVGSDAAEAGVDELFLVGARASAWMRLGALGARLAPGRIHACADTDDAARQLSVLLRPADTLLLKGSRGMTLEAILSALRQAWEATP